MNKKLIVSGLVSLFTVVAAAPLAHADEARPAPVVTSPDKAAPVEPKDPDEPSPGFALRLELPIVAPQGSLAKGLDALTPGVGIGGYGGYYVTPNVGIFAGAQMSFGHSQHNCDACKGTTLEIPVYVEFAQSKFKGAYGQLGAAFLPTTTLTDSTGAQVMFQNTADLKLGLGYRMSQRQLANNTTGSLFAFSLFSALSVGQYTNMTLTDSHNNETNAKVDPSKVDYHYTLTAGVSVAFLP